MKPFIRTCVFLSIFFPAVGFSASCSTDAPKAGPIIIKDADSALTAVAVTVCGHWIATGDASGCIKIWEREGDSLKRILAFNAHAGRVRSVAFFGVKDEDQSMLVSGGNDCTMRTWNLNKLIEAGRGGSGATAEQEEHIGTSRDVGVSVQGGFFAGRIDALVADLNARMRAPWQDYMGEHHFMELYPEKYSEYRDSLEEAQVLFAVPSRCEHMIAYERGTGEISLGLVGCTAAGDFTLRKESSNNERVTWMAFSPCSRLLIAGFNDKTVRIWDVLEAKQVKAFQVRSVPRSVACFSGKSLCTKHMCISPQSFAAITLDDGTLCVVPLGFTPDRAVPEA